jgi:hypothetical protein
MPSAPGAQSSSFIAHDIDDLAKLVTELGAIIIISPSCATELPEKLVSLVKRLI